MIGQPMDASGFRTLASYFPDRTVIIYDPRGLGRSIRTDGRVDSVPTVQADDVHAIIGALDAGAVEMFASSGGAVTALALVAAYPNDVTVLVAQGPPLVPVLPDAEAARPARSLRPQAARCPDRAQLTPLVPSASFTWSMFCRSRAKQSSVDRSA
jgi:pimeloyl-ACP methyl ester carboxylesterase